MAKPTLKQHVPVFVGSTFSDLEDYRKSCREALHRLEAIVRGMEYFGSKPGTPLEECLNAVRSCKIYIGIFAMRYGSIPDGHDKSMTHLEYEEAQKLQLPSLIYILDENHQPVLPIHVETGSAAEKLKSLKSHLKNKHTLSYFTTKEDLTGKILKDLPSVLSVLGTTMEGPLVDNTDGDSVLFLKNFKELPRRYQGKEIIVDLTTSSYGGFSRCDANVASSLYLTIGDVVSHYCDVSGDQAHNSWYVYGEGDIAVTLIGVPSKSRIRARVKSIYGVTEETEYSDDGTVKKKEEQLGLLIIDIIDIEEVADASI